MACGRLLHVHAANTQESFVLGARSKYLQIACAWCIQQVLTNRLCLVHAVSTYESLVFGGLLHVVAKQSVCHILPQSPRLELVLQFDRSDALTLYRKFLNPHLLPVTLRRTKTQRIGW